MIVLIAVIAFAAGCLGQWLTGMRMVVLLLLLPVAGEAGELLLGPETKPTFCYKDGNNVLVCALSDIPPTIYGERDPCLATMEAAMRAMEPYTFELDEKDQARAIIKNYPVLRHALKQWDEAKRQCWRQP